MLTVLGAAENHIKSWKTHLVANRTSCTRATANQFPTVPTCRRLLPYVWAARRVPKRSSFAATQFGTLRLRLIKIAAVEMKTQIRLAPAASCRTSASCASSSVASRNARYKQTGRRRPTTTPLTSTANPRILLRGISAKDCCRDFSKL
ncbi:transposase [Mesorhizobium sp. M1423]|uniref:transposase n=1 Tax=Mesorhizobium sp. M1423 TaxID=2957101 RepID=UPI003334E3CA